MARLQPRVETAPQAQTRINMNPTLIVSWFCTIFSVVVILIRVLGRWVRTERLFKEDKIILWAIVPLVMRMAFVHPVLLWGTNNVQTLSLSDQDIRHRSMGSRLVLASRIFYAIYIWTAKFTVLEFVQRIIATSWTKFYDRGAKIIYTFLGLTLVAVIISTLAECQPGFFYYWQVSPDPGPSCRTGKAQLITMGVCDIITDVVLVAFPIPMVLMSKSMPAVKKISMVGLFLLSLILIAITGYRIPSTASRGYGQQYRSLLASLEILAATCVANVIVIGSFLRDKGVKKIKYRGGSLATSALDDEGSILTRPATRQTKPSIARRHWGSDEDLVRDFGLGVSADLREDSGAEIATRLAPVAEPAQVPYQDVPSPEPTINPQGRGLLDPAWTFRTGSHQISRSRRSSDASSSSESSSDFKLRKLEPYSDEPASPGGVPETPYKKMSFFDVGGLADAASSERSSFDHHPRRLSRSGHAFIADVGGLMGVAQGSNQRDDEDSAVSSSASGYRASNLLAPENMIRERSTSPGGRMTVAEVLRATRIRNPVHLSARDVAGPDSLNLSDAGGLLR